MNDEQITAILGLVLLTQPDHTIRIPFEVIQGGLPENSGVSVEQDEARNELVISIKAFEEEVEE